MASLDIGLFALQSQFRLPNSLRRKFLLYSQLRHPTTDWRRLKLVEGGSRL